MKCVLVIEKDGEVRQRVPYSEDGAIIRLYDKESRIVWESMEGRYYTDSIMYDTKRLFYEPRFLELCKKYADAAGVWQEQSEEEAVTLENIKEKGFSHFDEREMFKTCSAAVRDGNYKEEEFLTHLCFELFNRQQYDKVTLIYLSNYYCGATRDMKRLWNTAHEYGIPVNKLGERIITQMVLDRKSVV